MPTSRETSSVVVVGSINGDRRLEVERLPRRGETVLARTANGSGGGKGANQAVAAASAGARVALLAAVGADDEGSVLLAELTAAGVDVSAVRILPGCLSGSATVVVETASGDNLIVVDPGANHALTADDLDPRVLGGADVVLLQREITDEVNSAAVGLARGFVILNPAPAATGLEAILTAVDLIVPNRRELSVLAGSTASENTVESALRLPGEADVLVTLGAEGAVLVERPSGRVSRFPAPRVSPLDTTGAGDCLCGVLAAGLAAGLDLHTAVGRAVAAATRSTLTIGARRPSR